MDALPVIARGHNLAAFVPPVLAAAYPYLRAISHHHTIVLTADRDRASALASLEVAGTVVIVSGLTRAARRLATGTPGFLIASTEDALALLERSALKPGEIETVVIAWPEQLGTEGRAALEAVMAECPKEAQRIILSSATGPDVADLVERYAFKAMTHGFPAPDAPPAPPIGAARYVIAGRDRFDETRRRVLDALNPETDDALLIAPCPESREGAAALAAALKGPPVFVIEPCQLPWLRSLYAPLSAVPLPVAVEALERRADVLRAKLTRAIETGDLDRELFLLAPLLARFDAAEVAAAALKLAESPSGARGTAPSVEAVEPGPAAVPTWARLWVGVGRKDNVRPGDLVGAIVGEAKIPADRVGKIEVRELYCLVEVRPEVAERVVSALTGATLRGRRLTARLDRGPTAGRPPRRG